MYVWLVFSFVSQRRCIKITYSSGQKIASFHLLVPSLGNKNRVNWGLEKEALMMRLFF